MLIRMYFVVTALSSVFGFGAWADNHASGATTENAGMEESAAAVTKNVDLEAAKRIFDRNCRACRGNKAQGVASYPKLSDKDPNYIVDKLKTYRSGEKIGPNSVLMIQNAKNLSDEDIANLAVYVTTAFD